MEHWLWIILAALFFGKIETTCFDSFLKISVNCSSEQKSLNSWAVSVHTVTLYTSYFPLSPFSLINNVNGFIFSASSRTNSWRQNLSCRRWSQWKRRRICHTHMSIWDKIKNVYLNWYRHHPDLQTPQFILWKGTRSQSQYIPDKRYQSQTSTTETDLTIRNLTLADTALYYCALETQWYKV